MWGVASSVSSVSSSGASISCCLFACRFGRIAVSFGLGNDVEKENLINFNCFVKTEKRTFSAKIPWKNNLEVHEKTVGQEDEDGKCIFFEKLIGSIS